MGEGFCGRGREPDGGAGPDEGHVEPEGQAVHHSGGQHVKLQRDLDPVQIRLLGGTKVNHMALSLGHANANVKSVDLKREGEAKFLRCYTYHWSKI